MTSSSDVYVYRDPQRIRERQERKKQFSKAQGIANAPEEQWVTLVGREPRDEQEGIWEFLRAIRRARSIGHRL